MSIKIFVVVFFAIRKCYIFQNTSKSVFEVEASQRISDGYDNSAMILFELF